MLRAVREAFPAQAAVISADWPRAEFAGFEAPWMGGAGFYALFAGGAFSSERLTNGIGDRFLVEELTFKPWPSCRGTHPFIEIGLELAAGGWEGIESIEVVVSPVQQMLVEPLERKRAPEVVIDAKFSIPFAMAVAIVRGHAGLDDFAPDALRDGHILAMAQRIGATIMTDPALDSGAGGAAIVRRRDGTCQRYEVRVARGAPSRPMHDDELAAKFADCASRAAVRPNADRIRTLADAIANLRDLEDAGRLANISGGSAAS